MDSLVPALVPRVTPRPIEVLREKLLGAAEVTGQIEQLRVVTQLLENIDRLEWLGVLSTKQRLNLRGRDEQSVERELQL